jgi:hypothetical protein
VVAVPAPGTGTRTRHTTSTTRPAIQALTPEELYPCDIDDLTGTVFSRLSSLVIDGVAEQDGVIVVYPPAGSQAVDDGFGFRQACASQFPVTLDGMNLLAGRDQSDNVGRNVITR